MACASAARNSRPPTKAIAAPTVIVEVAFATDPGAAPTWVNISSYVLVVEDITRSGRQYELDQAQAGTMTMLLDNRDRRFEPEYAAGPYYPNVVPMRRVRVRTTSPTSNLYAGYINNWAARWGPGPNAAVAQVEAVDGFETLAVAPIVSTPATLTAQGLLFTAKSQRDGNAISVEFRGLTDLNKGPLVDVVGKAIRFWIRLDGSGNYDSTAQEAMQYMLGDQRVTELVSIELDSGSSAGASVLPAAPAYLSGADYLQEQSGTRITRVLDDISWPAGDRVIDTGVSTISASSFSAEAEQKALPHMLDVASSELGVAFIDGQGRFVFHDRHRRLTGSYVTAEVVFGDNPGEFPYMDLTPEFDKERIKNVIALTRSEDNYLFEVEDSTSKTRFLPRPLSRSVLLDKISDLEDQGRALLTRMKDPHLRVSTIQVRPGYDTTNWTAALGLEVSDRVTVKRRPPGGGAVLSFDCHVERIHHSAVGKPEWSIDYELSPADTQRYWILGDATYSVLGSTTVPAY